jgi:4-amino-4-deoxy-L-arabinose transferase-like glycosyltransferase
MRNWQAVGAGRHVIDRITALFIERPAHYLIPAAILIALWLPGATQGWLRTDSHYYAAIGLDAWLGSISSQGASYNSKAHLLDLRLGELPYHNKPPLAFWIHGLFLMLASPGESDRSVMFWARLPSLLAAITACLLWVRTVKILAGPRLALVAGIVLALTLEFFRYTRAISLDLHLAWTMTLALMLAARAMSAGQPSRLMLAGLGIGLGLLVKPGVALLLVPALAIWIGWSYGKLMLKRCVLPLLGMTMLALCIAGPWYIWMHTQFPSQFIDTIVVEQTAERFKASNARPWFYYLALLGETYGPMLICLIGAIIAWRRGVPAGQARSILRLAIVVGVGWLAIISFASDKHGRYMMPSLIVFSAIAAWWIDVAFIQKRLQNQTTPATSRSLPAWTPAAIMGIGIVAAVVVSLAKLEVHSPRDPRWEVLANRAGLERSGAMAGSLDRAIPVAESGAMFTAGSFRMMGYDWPRWIGKHREHEPPPGGLIFSRRSTLEGYEKLPESFSELGLFRKLPERSNSAAH